MRLPAGVAAILVLATVAEAQVRLERRYTVQSAVPAETENLFGASIAAVPPYLLVGCPHAEEVPESADIFALKTGVHVRTLQLQSPSPDGKETFGTSVALVGSELAVVGEPGAEAVRVFDIATGTLVRTIVNPAPGAASQFGVRLALLDPDLLVGTMDDLVYRIDPRSGRLRQTYVNPAPGGPGHDRLGNRNLNPIAALGHNVLAVVNVAEGRAVQRYDGHTGRPVVTYRDPAASPSTEFGTALATLRHDVLVGAPGDGAGAVHRFDARGTLRRTYRLPSGASAQRFGTAVATLPRMIFVGAPYDIVTEDGYPPSAGALFVLSTTGRLHDRLDDPFSDSVNFGAPLAAAGAVVVAGHLGDSGRDAGLVHAFGRQRSCGDVIGCR